VTTQLQLINIIIIIFNVMPCQQGRAFQEEKNLYGLLDPNDVGTTNLREVGYLFTSWRRLTSQKTWIFRSIAFTVLKLAQLFLSLRAAISIEYRTPWYDSYIPLISVHRSSGPFLHSGRRRISCATGLQYTRLPVTASYQTKDVVPHKPVPPRARVLNT
jgi:hypothetical protein